MLGREFKLKNSETIKRVLKEGSRCRSANLTLFQQVNSAEHCRGAVVISRKVAGSAVERNRIRRVIFGVLERQFGVWANPTSSDMVVMVTSKPSDNQILVKELEACFEPRSSN